MSYLRLLESISKFCAGRLYAQLAATFFGFFFVIGASMFAWFGWYVTKDPETGTILVDATSLRLWMFVGSLLVLAYALITQSVLLIALRRYRTDRSDHRPLLIGAYMLMPIFPVGTIFSIFALGRLYAENKETESGPGE
jgi:hypothetical protein